MKPPITLKHLLLFCFFTSIFSESFSQTTIFTYGANWKYSNAAAAPANDAQGDTWIETDYDDAAWSSANALFHVGESGGTDLGTLRQTTYFRRSFTVTGLASYTSFDINLLRDDGAVIYINGQQVGTSNMGAGPYIFSTQASSSIQGGGETTVNTVNVSTSYFNEGTNYIAIEVHQASNPNSDMRFNLELLANAPPPLSISRGPYLQMGGQTGITIRWRSNTASDSRVELGTSFGTYPIIVDDATSTTEHVVNVTGLSADTKYYYRIGSTTQALEGTASNFFTTVPPPNTTRKVRIAAFGDCGRNDLSFRTLSISNYQTYLSTNGIEAADAWILLGDNAYNNGTDAEYTSGFFTPFQGNIMKNHKLYPTPGNHDYYSATQTSRTHTYYQNFTVPTTGELGGVASGTESFYSFDIGNVHFLSLDSYGVETPSNTRIYDTLGPQVNWIKNDLAANTKKWVVAYFHHPPYTMGSHTSDGETELINIRNNFIRILERYGVDLVLCGHSHDYERSYLLNGHYGNEASFNAGTHAISSSSAMYNGTANSTPYTTTFGSANHGTVYVVAGSSGADGGVQAGYPHNAFPFSIDDGGMMYFEVDDNRLDAKFLRRDGSIGDQFTIMQDVNKTTNYVINEGESQLLTASWPGSYSWSTTETTRSITVTPAAGVYNYTVTDQYGNITDIFNVTVNAVLPVEMNNYLVTLRQAKVYVNWSTLSESNSKHFTIDRSTDARIFEKIGTINAAGNSNTEKSYQFIDANPLAGTSFYRLSQTDNDGNKKYYDIKRINNNIKKFYADIYQSASGEVTVQLYSSKNEKTGLRVVDMSGRTISKEDWQISEGSNKKSISLNKGIYIIEITNGPETISKKIIVK